MAVLVLTSLSGGISTFNSSIHVGVSESNSSIWRSGNQREVSFANTVDILSTLTVGSGSSSVIVGSATTQLIVNGDARITQ